MFTFLRGLLLKSDVVNRLIQELVDREYPGNSSIPEGGKDHYTYAGEIPWSAKYAPGMWRRNGKAAPEGDKAFTRYVDGRSTGVPVQVPVREYAWESYHSTLNNVSGVTTLAPEIAQVLGLVNHSNTWDLFERNGRQATLYVEFREGSEFHASHLFYIRKDLLQRYVREANMALVVVPWGERTVHYTILNSLRNEFDDAHRHYEHIHKRIHAIVL